MDSRQRDTGTATKDDQQGDPEPPRDAEWAWPDWWDTDPTVVDERHADPAVAVLSEDGGYGVVLP